MRGLKRKTAIILASAVVTTSILAGGTLTAFAAGPEHRRPKPHLLIPVRC